MNVTIKDIAKVAGVSHPTVSRALNDHPGLSPKTIERIKKIAEEMGYVPNATARGLKTNRTKALGVIVKQIDDPFWNEVLDGVDSVLHPAGYSLFIAATHRDKQREKEVVQSMVQRGVDGVILLAPQFSQEQSHILHTYGLPMATVNNEGAGECQYLIYNDDDFGIRQVTNHLIELGHKDIAFLGNRLGGLTNTNRLAGFLDELKRAGITSNKDYIYHVSSGNPEGGREGANYLLTLPKMPTAIVCYNDFLAVGVYNTLHEHGLLIPRDISVVGFDNIVISEFLTPPLTTLHQYKFELGVRAAYMLLEMLEQEKKQDPLQPSAVTKKISIRGELRIRASTAPPRE